MKKLVIILAIVIMLFSTQEQHRGTSVDSCRSITECNEKVHERHSEQAEQITEATSEPIPTESEVATKEDPAVQETPLKECIDEPKETVECVDKGDQTLAEYKSQSSGQSNPFENAPSAEIVDQLVEDLISEGEDRPGEGKHF